MSSSHHRRLLFLRKKDRSNGVADDEMPLMQESTSGLESTKFANFDQLILNSTGQWSSASRDDNDAECYTNDSDVDEDRDESHLLDLQRELEAAELGTAVSYSREDHNIEEEREESLLGDPSRISDYQSLASTSTADSFDVDKAIEKIKIQKKGMEQASGGSQEDVAAIDTENIRLAQFVAQMEQDFDGAILAMMETYSETTSEGTDGRKVVEDEEKETDRECVDETLQIPQFYPMETVKEEDPAAESHIEIFEDESCNDNDSDFTPFSVSEFPSEESKGSQLNSVDQGVLHYYNSPEVADLISPLTDYGSRPPLSPTTDYSYNPYQEREESSFEPCIDMDQLSTASVPAESTAALKEQRAHEATQHLVYHQVAVQHGGDDGYSYDDDYRDPDDTGNQWYGYFRKSKYPVTGASFLCLFHIMLQILLFRAFLGLLMDYHQSTTSTNRLLDPSSVGHLPFCQADSGCLSAVPMTLSENGEHEVIGATSMIQMNEKHKDDACEGSWFHSPTLWYSIVGDGRRHTAVAFPTSEDFVVSIMVLEGQCSRPDSQYSPSQCCGQAGESSLVWDTVAGKEYFIAVFGAQPKSSGSFQLTMWNTQRTEDALIDHIEQRGVDSFQDLTVGGSVGISITFLAAAVFA
ncbi:MAG: hypothetical protein SGBAC_008018 [Bacillariaceae sp.]